MKYRLQLASLCASCVALFALLSIPAHAVTLEEVRDNEGLVCGVTTGQRGFSAPDSKNNWHGMEVDLCRSIALTIFGSTDEDYYVLTPLTSSERLAAVSTERVHLLAAKTHWNWVTSIDYNLEMIGPYFRDGQGFMVRNDKKVSSIWNLQNTSICVIASSVEELQVRRFMKRLKYHSSLSFFENTDDLIIKFQEGACEAISADLTILSSLRRKLRNPLSVSILPQLLTQKPIGILASTEDPEWPQLIQLVFSMLVQAEELGLTSRNVVRAQKEGSVLQKAFIKFGEDERFDIFSGDNWILEVISTYGNYGEMYRKNFGAKSSNPIPRGLNRLWFTGGLVAPTPLYSQSQLPEEEEE